MRTAWCLKTLLSLVLPLLLLLPATLVARSGQWFELPPSFFFVSSSVNLLPTVEAMPDQAAQAAGYPDYKSVRHLDWGTALTRVTSNQQGRPSALHRYSRRQAWNADESLLDIGDKVIDAKTYEVVSANLDISTARNWSFTKPSIMYGIRYVAGIANSLTSYDVLQNQHTELARFESYSACSLGNGEGSLSIDERYLVVNCNKAGSGSTFLLSFDIVNKQVLATHEITQEFNWASFSQSGQYIVVELKNVGSDNHDELIRFSPTFTDSTVISTQTNHGDLGKDVNGDDVFVMIDWDYISYVRLEDGTRVNLSVSSPYGPIAGHGHVSCRNVRRPGWCYVSSYAQGILGAVKIAQQEQLAPSYDNEGVLAFTGKAEMELWGYHRSTSATYKAQPKVSASPTGTQIIFSSDWHGSAAADDYVLSIVEALPQPSAN